MSKPDHSRVISFSETQAGIPGPGGERSISFQSVSRRAEKSVRIGGTFSGGRLVCMLDVIRGIGVPPAVVVNVLDSPFPVATAAVPVLTAECIVAPR